MARLLLPAARGPRADSRADSRAERSPVRAALSLAVVGVLAAACADTSNAPLELTGAPVPAGSLSRSAPEAGPLSASAPAGAVPSSGSAAPGGSRAVVRRSAAPAVLSGADGIATHQIDASTAASQLAPGGTPVTASAVVGTATHLVWQNVATGEGSTWSMSGSSWTGQYGLLPTVPTQWQTATAADFNGDGKADLVWQNGQTGERSIWFMSGSTYTGSYALLPTVAVQWSIAGAGDFNGDGKPDLVWQNTATGDRSIWFMNGSTYTGSYALLPNVPAVWRIAAVEDFNGDGKPDLVWQNTSTGERSIWFMNGSTWTGSYSLLPTVSPAWTIAAAGDFNADGKADLVWQNPSTGDRSIWFMSGATWTGSYALLPNVSGQWRITAAGNFAGGTSSTPAPATPAPSPPAVGSDVGVVNAVWTQGVQKLDGSYAMVLGAPAVVNVLLRGVGAGAAGLPGQLALVLRDSASGALARADTILPSWPGTLNSPTLGAPSAQFLVPAGVLRAGLTWRVVRDPRGVARDDSSANDAFPRAGEAPLRTINLPPLRVRLVPITLAADGGATASVPTSGLEKYLRTMRATYPVGSIDAAVRPAVATGASYGVPPTGVSSAFWTQALQDLNLAHVAAGEADIYWYGVVQPPAAFTVQGGVTTGMGYVPSDPTMTGYRTSLGLQAEWLLSKGFGATVPAETFAHELAHNHGRQHAPCGNPGASDPSFPVANGTLGTAGVAHDVYSWAMGLTSGATPLPASTPDFMGYCSSPTWASTYTYDALLAVRTEQARAMGYLVAASRAPMPSVELEPATPGRVLVVQGQVDADGRIALRPAVTIEGRSVTPRAATGAYRLVGLDSTGAELFSHAFAPTALDHDGDVSLFTVAVSLPPRAEGRLAELRVTGPAGRVARLRAARAASGAATLLRASAGVAHVACGDPSAAAVVVADAATGEVLASGRGARIAVPGAGTRALRVDCSDGVRTTSRVLR